MTRRPWYKRYGRDFIHGCANLTLEEIGAYTICLDEIYDHGGPIPDDARYLAGICRTTLRKWRAIRAALVDKGKLYEKDGLLGNRRADKELDLADQQTAEAVENGKIGGRKSAENRSKIKDNPKIIERKLGDNGDAREIGTNKNNSLAQATLDHRAGARGRVAEGRDQIREKESDEAPSVPSGTGADAPPIPTGGKQGGKETAPAPELPGIPTADDDEAPIPEFLKRVADPDKAWIFSTGMEWLAGQTKKTTDALRPLIGKWLSANDGNAAALRRTIESAMEQAPAEALAYLTKAVENAKNDAQAARAAGRANGARSNGFHRPGAAVPHHVALDEQMRMNVRGFLNTGIWPASEGKPPTDPGCRYPARILAEFATQLEMRGR